MPEADLKALLEAGVHFGHQTRRWNPNMRRFIFGELDGIHIIDLLQTEALLENARRFAGLHDEAQRGIQQELPLVGERLLEVGQRVHVAPGGVQPVRQAVLQLRLGVVDGVGGDARQGRQAVPQLAELLRGMAQPAQDLAHLARDYGGQIAAHDTAARTRNMLLTTSIEDVMQNGLHEFLEDFIVANDKLANEITEGYRFYK